MKSLVLLSFILSLSTSSFGGIWHKKTSIGGTGRHRGIGGNAYSRGYFGLGHVNGAGADISYRDWWEYNPATDSWSQKTDFPVANHGAVSFSLNNRIYVGGGSAFSTEFYAYDPLINQWLPIANCPLAVGDVQGFAASDKGYAIYTNQLAEYDPISDTWSLKASVPVNVSNWSCTFSNGTSGFLKVGHSLFEYKPSQDQWIARANHPGLSNGGSYGFSINGIGYVTSGYVGGLSTVTEEVWSFNPASNAWTREADFPGSSRRFPAAFTIGNKGYFGLGTNGINLNDVWEFDPSNTLDVNNETSTSLTIYPNPCTEVVYLNGATKPYNYAIYSVSGNMFSKGSISGSIDVSFLASGSYIITIDNHPHALVKN